MNQKFKRFLDKAFEDVLNSDRAQRGADDALSALDALRRYLVKYEPQASTEISAVSQVSDLLETLAYEGVEH